MTGDVYDDQADEYERDYHQEYKDDLAQGHIYPDGTQRDPDEPDCALVEASEVPEGILRTWVHVPADAWERLSEHRWRALHTMDGFVECVVVAFGETMGRPTRRENEAAVFAELFEHAARLGAHRLACEDGTPIVRPDNKANEGVVGRCWWCGKWPGEHNPAAPRSARFAWGEVARDLDGTPS